MKSILLLALISVLGIGYLLQPDNELDKPVSDQGSESADLISLTVPGSDNEYSLEVALSSEAQRTGLSYRESLADNTGMLFIFNELDNHGIWMKDMNFNLDILWVDENKQIVYLKQAVTPESFPDIFTPNKPAKYVIEMSSGFISNENLQVGDKLVF